MGTASTQFQTVLSEELDSRSDGNQPKKTIFATLLPILLQLLVTAADNCLKGGSSVEAAAKSAVEPNFIVRARMRRLMIRDMYDGLPKRYNREGGDEMLEATFAASKRLGEPVMAQVFTELTSEPDPDTDWSMG